MCQHTKVETIVYGVTRCRTCHVPTSRPVTTTMHIGTKHVLAHGDPCYVTGIGDAVFFYVDTDRGGPFVHIKRANGGMANVTPDRVRPARRRFAARIDDQHAA